MKRKAQRGNALIEFAIGWSVLWLIFAGVFQFGYSFYIYNVLQTQVANAAELGSFKQYDVSTPSNFTTTLQNMVLYSDETAGTTPCVPGLAAANVNVNVTTDSTGTPHDVTVSIQNYTISAIFASFTPTNKPRATVKYMGDTICSAC
jgi:Flp pilus assembly protein TadG